MNLNINKGIIIFLVLLVLAYIFLFKPLKAKEQELEEHLKERESLLIESLSLEEGLPSEDAIMRLRQSQENKALEYRLLAKRVFQQPVSSLSLPQEPEKLPLYFRKSLYYCFTELSRKAQEKGGSLPPSLGFSSELPKTEEVNLLLNRLGVVRRFILIALDSDTRILAIKPLLNKESQNAVRSTQDEKKEQALEDAKEESKKTTTKSQTIALSAGYSSFVQEHSFLVKLRCSAGTLFRLFSNIQKERQFFLIKNIQIRQDLQRQGSIVVDLQLSGLLEKEEVTEEKEETKDESPG